MFRTSFLVLFCIIICKLFFSIHSIPQWKPKWFSSNEKIGQSQLSQILEKKQFNPDPSLKVGSWQKSEPSSLLYDEFLLERSFESAFFPQYYIHVDAQLHDYRLLYPLINTEIFGYCSLAAYNYYGFFLSQNFTCRTLYCPLEDEPIHPLAQKYSSNSFDESELEGKNIYEIIMGFCYYCGNILHNPLFYELDNSGLTQYEAFALAMNATYGTKNNYNGPCKNYTIPFSREACSGGYPFPFPDNTYPGSTYGQACYCPDSDRYGFRCDGYTSFLLPFRYEVLNYLLLIPIVISILICFFLVNVPFFSSRLVQWFALRHTAPDTMAKKFFTMFLDLKTPCHVFTLLACLFLIPEQLLSIPSVNNYVIAKTEPSRGVFVFLSFACMSFGFVSILILWSHICHQSVTRSTKLSIGNIIMMIILYAVIIIIAVAFTLGIAIAGGTSTNAISSLWPLYQSFTGLFFAVLIVGFFIYAIYMYVILKKVAKHMNKKVSFSSLKFTRFMFVADLWFLVIVIFLMTIVLSWIKWDMLSIIHYLITAPVVTILVLVECYIMLYLLFDRDFIIDGYLCCANKSLRNKWKKVQEYNDVEEEENKSEQQEKSKTEENQQQSTEDFGGFQLPEPKKKKNIMDELNAYDKQYGDSFTNTPTALQQIEMEAVSISIQPNSVLQEVPSSPTSAVQVPIEFYDDSVFPEQNT